MSSGVQNPFVSVSENPCKSRVSVMGITESYEAVLDPRVIPRLNVFGKMVGGVFI